MGVCTERTTWEECKRPSGNENMPQTNLRIIAVGIGLSFSLALGCAKPSSPTAIEKGITKPANALQERARAFLQRPIPKGMAYVPDSISERFIATYAADGKVELDSELAELLGICVTEARTAAGAKSGEEAEFYRESAEILGLILEQSKK